MKESTSPSESTATSPSESTAQAQATLTELVLEDNELTDEALAGVSGGGRKNDRVIDRVITTTGTRPREAQRTSARARQEGREHPHRTRHQKDDEEI